MAGGRGVNIDPETMGTWVAVGFVLALLALVAAFVAIFRVNAVLYGTQIEVLGLNKKIETLRQQQSAPVPMGAPAEQKPEAPGK
jgi:hypothetical protein